MANLQVGVAGNGTVTVGAGASVHSPASNTLTLGTNNSEVFRIASDGKIGIGSDSPSKKLHVHSGTSNNVAEFESSDTGAKITLRDPTTASSIQQFGGQFIIDADSDAAGGSSVLLLRVDGSEKVRITDGGKVLVGTSNEPSNKNTVTPSLNVSGSGVLGAAQITRHTSVGGGGALLHLAGTRGSDVNSYTILQSGDGIGTLAFNGADGNEFVTAAEVKAQVDGTPGDNDMPGRLIFTTTSDGASSAVERLRIRADGRVSIASSLAVVGVTTAAAFIPSSGQLSNRNKIINGAMTVSQRHGNSAVQLSASEQYFIDRWENDTGSSFDMKCDVSQSTEAPEGFSKSMKFDCDGVSAVSGGHNGLITTFIEGQDCQDFKFGTSNAEDITLSFYAKSGSQNNGHVYGVFLGAYLDSVRNAQTKGFTVTSSWQRFTMTFAGTGTVTSTDINANSAKGLQVAFSLACGPDDEQTYSTWTANSNLLGFTDQDNFFDNTSNELYITGIQLEVGSHATPFEHRSYAEELLRCQRYYQVDRSSNVNSMYESATTYNGKWYQKDHIVEMRAKPTVSTANGTNSISNSGWTGSTPTPYSSNTHTVYYSSGNAFHLAGTSDGNIGATYDSEL